jgi:hypothetical protein
VVRRIFGYGIQVLNKGLVYGQERENKPGCDIDDLGYFKMM